MPRIRGENSIISTRNIVDIELRQSYDQYVPNVSIDLDSVSDVASFMQITAEAGENILSGNAVALLNGLCYKATNLLVNEKAPIGILKSSVSTGQIATIITAGIITTSLTLDDTPNKPVYCRSGSLNLSQNLLTATSVDEDAIIEVGIPINTTQFLIQIKKPIQILD